MNYYSKKAWQVPAILVLAFFLFLINCNKQPTKPNVTTIKISLKKKTENKTNISSQDIEYKSSISKINSIQAIEQVRVLILDMTRWRDMQDFWESAPESDQGLLYKAARQVTWESHTSELMSYSGDSFHVHGDWSLNISNGYAEGTFNVNPGLNYLFIGLIEDNVLKYYGTDHARPEEGEEEELDIYYYEVYE